jgi:hypothetical protein
MISYVKTTVIILIKRATNIQSKLNIELWRDRRLECMKRGHWG